MTDKSLNHLEALEKKHADLNKKVDELEKQPSSVYLSEEIKKLKLDKLKVKDEIERFKNSI